MPSSTTGTVLTEAVTAGRAVHEADGTGRILVTLITPGVGSSGYYAPEVLEAAAADQVFPAGTHCYVNHPSESEMYDRPERSVDDLAAVLAEDARWDGGALVAEAQLFASHRNLAEKVGAIGMSIRAGAMVSEGEHDGRRMPIVDRLTEGISCDFVTHAGRGGYFQVLESARPSRVVASAVRHGVEEATANDTREALDSALRERFGGDQVWVWVRDFDATTVWYQLESPDGDATYALGYSLSDTTATLADGEPTEVAARTTYVPVNPAGQSTTQESEEDTMPENDTADRRIAEADGRVRTAEEATRAAEQRATVAESRSVALTSALNREVAQRVAREAADAAGVQLDPLQAAGLSVDPPLADDGTVDEAAMRTAADTAVAQLRERRGAGTVQGFGTPIGDGTSAASVSEADLDRIAADAFGEPVKGA